MKTVRLAAAPPADVEPSVCLSRMMRASLAEAIEAVRAICRTIGLGEVAPILLKASHHSILHIPSLAMVARVRSTHALDVALTRAERELAVGRHLAHRGAPVVALLADDLAGPHVAASAVFTLWPSVTHARTADETDAALTVATLAGQLDLPRRTVMAAICHDGQTHSTGAGRCLPTGPTHSRRTIACR